MNISTADFRRDWELAFRNADILWSRVGDHPAVLERRRDFLSDRVNPPVKCSEHEYSRFEPDVQPVTEWLATKWCSLYDEKAKAHTAYIFPDGFAALFFARLMWANENVLLRGQYEHSWKLSTTLSRARQEGTKYIDASLKASRDFIEILNRESIIVRAYNAEIPEKHQEAILQHYGFPTDLLDFTYSYDVALFFAEGGSDYLKVSDQIADCGSIYAVPTHALPLQALLTTLSPFILRPTYQRGVFIRGLPENEQRRLERFKLVFHHHDIPVWNGLGNIHFGSPVGLEKYLYPLSDPIEKLASHYRKKFRDTSQ